MRLRVLFVLAAGLWACETPIEACKNILPTDSGGGGGGGSSDAGGPGPVVDGFTKQPDSKVGECDQCMEVGKQYRITTLQVTSLDGYPAEENLIVPLLNDLWSHDIDRSELSILLEMTSATDTDIEIKLQSGAEKVDQSAVCTLPDTSSIIKGTRVGCNLNEGEKTSLNIYAGSTVLPKNCTVTGAPVDVEHVIPVQNVVFTATFTPSCDKVTAGKVTGVIPKDAIENICTCSAPANLTAEQKAKGDTACAPLDPTYVGGGCNGCSKSYISLKSQLSLGKVEYKCQDAKGNPGVCLEAVFEAVATDPLNACQ